MKSGRVRITFLSALKGNWNLGVCRDKLSQNLTLEEFAKMCRRPGLHNSWIVFSGSGLNIFCNAKVR